MLVEIFWKKVQNMHNAHAITKIYGLMRKPASVQKPKKIEEKTVRHVPTIPRVTYNLLEHELEGKCAFSWNGL